MDMKWLVISIGVVYCMAVDCKTCNSEDDCGENECCMTRSRNYGKAGTCTSLSREHGKCNMVEEKLTKHGGKFFMACPCKEGLICSFRQGSHMREYIVGPMAVLVLKCRKTTAEDAKKEVILETPTSGGQEGEVIYEEVDISDKEIVDEKTVNGKKTVEKSE